MKIAFIGHKRIPSREGGIEIVVDELATRMVDRGHQVIAYNRSGHNVAGSEFDGVANGHGKRFSYHGVNVVSVPTIEGKGLARTILFFFLPHYKLSGQTGRDPLSCRRSLRHVAPGCIGRAFAR